MGKALEQLSKDLAKGISRRTAFGRFFAAIGGLGAALLTGRRAEAQGNSICVQLCKEQGFRSKKELGECISASAKCPPGSCALVTNGTGLPGAEPFCVPVDI